MILLSNAVDSKIASATSTYPALILKVQQSSSNLFKNIQFYCPTTMSGSPTDACFATNNWIEAPVKPHNGAEDYDFRPGGVIIISYADGNLSSPQFVRWLNVSDDIIETNYGYILGNPIVPEAVLSIWDDQITLSDPILQKAVMLLPYIQICARGSKSLTASQYIQRITRIDKSLVYRKCGKYGIEVLSKGKAKVYETTDGKGKTSIEYEGDLDHLYKTKYAPNTTFLNICNYLLSKSNNKYKIVEIFNRASSIVDSTMINSINKDETTALYLFQMLAGYGSFKNGGSILNGSIYENYNKESIKRIEAKTTGSYIGYSNFYNNNYITETIQREKFCSYFWYAFDYGLDAKNTYNKEIDRIYAIIMHNNLFRLKQSWFEKSYTKILVCCSIIATAYPSIEYYILHPDAIENKEMNNFLLTLKNIQDSVIGGTLPNGQAMSQYLSEMFSKLFYQYALEIKNIDVTKTEIYKNIQLLIRSILADWGTIYSKLGETLTSKPGIYVPSEPSISSGTAKFLWPVPGYPIISSPFGPRSAIYKDGKLISSAKNHNGIDISSTGINGKPVIASAAGTVIRSEFNQHGFGNYIVIKHENGYITEYAHLSARYVYKDNYVAKGQKIGLVGTTGASTGPHLHFGMKYNNSYVNPQNYVKYGN